MRNKVLRRDGFEERENELGGEGTGGRQREDAAENKQKGGGAGAGNQSARCTAGKWCTHTHTHTLDFKNTYLIEHTTSNTKWM